MAASRDELPLTPEGRAAVLGPARERYYRLVLALAESRWQERLRQELPLLQEARRQQDVVDALLDAAPAQEAEVHSLREQLAREVARKLGRGAQAPLSTLLDALVDWLVTLPREIPAHLREPTAAELLPDSLPALREAVLFAERLEPLFAPRPRLSGRLPFTGPEREALALGWARGEAALASLWRRLSGVDARGFLVAELRERAAQPPAHPPRTGPERLVHAAYWHHEAQRQLLRMAWLRLAPLEPGPSEALGVLWWLFDREYAPHVRLHAPELFSEPRAGLLEMAYELWDVQRPELPEDERWTPARFARWEKLARQADEGRQGEDGERVHEALRGLLERHGSGTRPGRRWWGPVWAPAWGPARLTGLVEQARDVLG